MHWYSHQNTNIINIVTNTLLIGDQYGPCYDYSLTTLPPHSWILLLVVHPPATDKPTGCPTSHSYTGKTTYVPLSHPDHREKVLVAHPPKWITEKSSGCPPSPHNHREKYWLPTLPLELQRRVLLARPPTWITEKSSGFPPSHPYYRKKDFLPTLPPESQRKVLLAHPPIWITVMCSCQPTSHLNYGEVFCLAHQPHGPQPLVA